MLTAGWGGSFDLIVFDNINSLCSGDTIGPEGWKRVDERSLDLKATGVGQLWLHHTGHNTSHEYGTVIRRNDMDTVVKLRPLQSTPERRSFALDFEKARFADRAPAVLRPRLLFVTAEQARQLGGSRFDRDGR